MIKCMFQECNCKATKTINCLIDCENSEIDGFVAYVCDFHYKLMTEKSACKSFSFEIVGGKKND